MEVLRRIDWYRYAPFEHVVGDLRSAHDLTASRALDEINRRWRDGCLSEGQKDRIVDLLLSEQGGSNAIPALHDAVCEELDGIVIENCNALHPNDLDRYFKNMLTFTARSRPVVAAGRPIAIEVHVSRNFTSSSPYTARIVARRVFLNEHSVTDTIDWHYDRATDILTTQLPGIHEGDANIEIELTTAVYAKKAPPREDSDREDEGGEVDAPRFVPEAVDEPEHLISCKSRVVSAEQGPKIRAEPVDPRWTPGNSDAFNFRTAPKLEDDGIWLLSGGIRLDIEFPSDLAVKVFAIVRDKTYPLHDSCLCRKSQVKEEYYAQIMRSRTEHRSDRPGFRLHICGELPLRPTRSIGLILRASSEAALGSVDLETIGDVEYRLDGIPVERCDSIDDDRW